MIDIEIAVGRFFQQVANGAIEIYNEFSLQHELGIFLRTAAAPSHYKVQFERPVGFFGLDRSAFVKKEIDLTVFSPDKAERVAIEVKFPRNGQYPEQMFKFCQDVAFVEQLVWAGFNSGFFVVAADDPNFYSGLNQTGIYSPFRGTGVIEGTITKPTGSRDETVQVYGRYRVEWQFAGELKYACISANHPSQSLNSQTAFSASSGCD